MKPLKSFFVISLLFAIVSCGDFLEERSQNMAYVETTGDLEEILLGDCYFKSTMVSFLPNEFQNGWGNLYGRTRFYFPIIHVMDDDAEECVNGFRGIGRTDTYPVEFMAAAHHWQKNPFLDAKFVELKDEEWETMYKAIGAINSVLYQLEERRKIDPDEALINKIEGEARFLRGYYYFWLVNIYGKPYRKSSADKDYGVPLKTTAYIEDIYFTRSSVKDVYASIVSDLERSAECLAGVKHRYNLRADQFAAYALLSRVYLYMEEYQDAIRCASEAIKGKYKLLDLNTLPIETSFTHQGSPEVMFTQGPNGMGVIHSIEQSNAPFIVGSYGVSSDLRDCFNDNNDLRINHFFQIRKITSTIRCIKWKNEKDKMVSDRWLIRLAEAYLNKAEAEAVLGNSNAVSTIQELRATRFKTGTLAPINYTGADLVKFVRDERRRELCFEAHRWFDLRRYAVNEKYPFTKTIEHKSYGYTSIDPSSGTFYEKGKSVLKPYSEDEAAYVLPIPRHVIEFHKGAIVNEVRSERLIK